MNITLTITASADLMALLGAMFQVFNNRSIENSPPIKSIKKPSTKIDSIETPPEETTSGVEPVTLAQVKDLVHTKSQAGKKDGIKAVLKEFEVNKVTELTSDQYAAFFEKITAL